MDGSVEVQACQIPTLLVARVWQIRHNRQTVDEPHLIKELIWIGSSRKDLKALPDEVRRVIGYALYRAQEGKKAPEVKVLTGFGGAGVLETVDDYQTDTTAPFIL